MPLTNLTSAEALRRPTVVYNAADGSGRTYGATVVRFASRPATPTITDVTTSASGGTLGATLTTSYRLTVVVNGIESLPSAADTVITGAGTTNSNTVVWPAVGNAEFYRVYGRTGGSEALMATLPAGTLQFVDTGAVTPSGALPAGALPAGAATLRIHTMPGSDAATSPRLLATVQPATSVGQAGRYEYHRI